MQITKHKAVSIDYKLTNPQGEVLDTSEGRGPLTYIHGAGGLIPGLETALEGKAAGQTFTVTIPPEAAYGEKDPAMVQPIPRSNFGAIKDIHVGQQFHARGPHGVRVVTVVGVNDDTVTVDGNHPLAGVTLNFDVTIVDVRDATEEEIAHGHTHGSCSSEGGCEGCGGGCH
jgi:FKBP-type peptidyl-prolyl cis-trans isomerase SlyD